jgi:tetratricopeptide (TPR) repeat protein
MAHGNLGSFLMPFLERRGEAVSHLEAALRIRPDSPETHNNLGLCLSDAGLCDAAIPHFETAIREAPHVCSTHVNLGICLMKKQRYPEAVTEFQRALSLDPSRLLAQINLALSLANIPGREKESVEAFESVLKLHPDLVDAHRGLAELLVKLDRPDDAITHLEAAERVQPDEQSSKLLAQLRARRK